MAKAVIINTSKSRTSTAKSIDYSISSISGESHNAKITHDVHTATPHAIDYGIAKITDINHGVKLSSIIPFYVKFTNIGIPTYGPNNVPPIGIAIVGVNNYIL